MKCNDMSLHYYEFRFNGNRHFKDYRFPNQTEDEIITALVKLKFILRRLDRVFDRARFRARAERFGSLRMLK